MKILINFCNYFIYFSVIILSCFLCTITSIVIADLILPVAYQVRLENFISDSVVRGLSVLWVVLILIIMIWNSYVVNTKRSSIIN